MMSHWLKFEYSGAVYERLFTARITEKPLTDRQRDTIRKVAAIEASVILLWRWNEKTNEFVNLEEPNADVHKVINLGRQILGKKGFWGNANSIEGMRALEANVTELCGQTDPVWMKEYQWRAPLCGKDAPIR